MKRSEKAAVIEQVKARASNASIAVVTDFKGMTVEEMTSLRVKLRQAGGEFVVVKNTLARQAFTDTKHTTINDKFKDNCAIALGFEEPVALAKAITEFAKTSKIFKVRHASLDGKLMTVSQLEDLAKLPPRDVLLAQLLGTMNAVPTSFVSLLANTMRPLLYVLKAIEEKKAA